MKLLILAATIIASLFTGVNLATQAHADSYSPVIAWQSNRPCPTEDSVNCAWNAGERGNGTGHSFIVYRFPHRVCWVYDQPHYSRHHNHCERD